MSIQELREKRAAKIKEVQAFNELAENWTKGKEPESQKKFDEMKAEVESLTRSIERIEESLRMTATLAAPAGSIADIRVGTDREAARPFNSLGEQLIAIYRAGQSGANADKRLLHINEQVIQAVAGTGSQESIAEEGGFFVQQDIATELITLADESNNDVLFSRCAQRPISSAANSLRINGIDETSRATGSRYSGIRIYTSKELEQMTETRPKFSKIELKVDKLTGLWYTSDEELADAAFLASEVSDLFMKEFRFKRQDLIYRGAGAGEPLGVLNANCVISVAKETSQSAATVVHENIAKMWARLPAGLRGEAIWVINQDVEPELDKLYIAVGTSGVPTYMPPGGIADAPYGRLKGRPVIPIEHCETLGTVGDIMLLAMSAYIWATKGGIEAASSIHLKFDYNQTAFRWTMRVDGQPRFKSAVTPFKGTNTVSPFIKLATRA